MTGRETVGCAEARALAGEAIIETRIETGIEPRIETGIIASRPEIPTEARRHALSCAACEEAFREMARADSLLAAAFREARSRLGGPSPERMQSILSGARPFEALLLRRVRRTVNRMLWLTLLALALLPLCALAWWLLRLMAVGAGP